MNNTKLLALATTGGEAGNIIALADVLVATMLVGKNPQYKAPKIVFYDCLIYLLLVIIVGLAIV